MRVLAFDACLGAVSATAGIVRADGGWERKASEIEIGVGGHAEALMPMLDRVMRETRLAFTDLERIVVTLGPGGFTGVRVAVAAARGLVLATGAAGIGISTLDALAMEARHRLGDPGALSPVSVVVDARRDMVFFAHYAPGEETAAPHLLDAHEAAARIAEHSPHALVGSAAETVARLAARLGPGAERLLTDLQPDAATFGGRAAHRAGEGPLTPIYLRPPDAKAQTSFILPRAVS